MPTEAHRKKLSSPRQWSFAGGGALCCRNRKWKAPVVRTLAGKGAAHRAKASPAVVCFCWILATSHHLALVSFRIIANHSKHGPFVSLVYFPGVHLPAYLTLPGQLEVNVRCHKTSPDRLPNHHLFHCSFVWLHFFLTV